MIAGIGVDMVAIERIRNIQQKYGLRFFYKILTETEIKHIPQAAAVFAAGRFAAKEAAVKALGTGFSMGITPRDIEILNDENGRPNLSFLGPAQERAQKLGIKNFHISISHERHTAIAMVILEV